MSPSYPSARWSDIDAFCAADDWRPDDPTDHYFWEKTLPEGEVLHTKRSFSDDEIGEDLFRQILRVQLKVTRAQFWNTIKTGTPVDRPVEPLEEVQAYEPWVMKHLLLRGYSEDQIRELTPEEAKLLVHELWSQPPQG